MTKILTTRWSQVAALVLLAGAAGSGQAPPPALAGRWDATVVVNKVEVPFIFEIAGDGKSLTGSFFNGDRRITSTSSEVADGTATFSFAQFGSTLRAKVEDGRLTGEYQRARGTPYAFQAGRAATAILTSDGDVPAIGGTWLVGAKSRKGETAWRFIVQQTAAQVSATILRVDGDTGTLTGSYRDGRFVLSHFSGARPLLLEVTPAPDGTLLLKQNNQTELVAAREDADGAKAFGTPTDPGAHTTVKDAGEVFQFSFPDLDGRIVSNTDDRFRGKVLLVNISGSWCPNCHDEEPFLVALYEKYRDKGLEVVTLSFEEAEQQPGYARLRAFIKTYGIQSTVLVPGEPDTASAKLPQAVNLNAFPTSFFVGRDGRVRGTHAGFPSPGSGEYYKKAERDVTTTIEKLLAEQVDHMVATARARLAASAVVATLILSSAAAAQMQRPDIKVAATPIDGSVKAGGTVTVRLSVRLPQDVHVQSDKPRDPSLIPTALTLVPPAGFWVEKIIYPKAVDLSQSGRAEPLAVFGGEFVIEARLTALEGIPHGEHQVQATLRYQACNETLCFAPARATAQWTITVRGSD